MIKDLLTPFKIANKIRLGNKCDGGYVVSEDHIFADTLISLGCDNQTSFEEAFLELNPNSNIFIYDKNSKCDLADNVSNVHFENKQILTFEDMSIHNNSVVQMDIEGSEYDLLKNYVGNFDKINQLIIEFHFHFSGNTSGWENVLTKLNDSFYLVHIHANNCTEIKDFTPVPNAIECTYVNKSLFNQTPDIENTSYPLQNLDFVNCNNKPDLTLDWWL